MLIFFCKGGILKNIPFTHQKTFYKNLYGTGSLISAPFPTAHKLITQIITFKIIIIGPRRSPKIGPITGMIKINQRGEAIYKIDFLNNIELSKTLHTLKHEEFVELMNSVNEYKNNFMKISL